MHGRAADEIIPRVPSEAPFPPVRDPPDAVDRAVARSLRRGSAAGGRDRADAVRAVRERHVPDACGLALPRLRLQD